VVAVSLNPAASSTGSPVPVDGSYTAFNSGGNLVGVSAVNPLPVSLGNASIGGNPAASIIGNPIGSYAGLTGFSNSSGYTTVVSGSSPLPVYADALATTSPLTLVNNQITPLNLNLAGELRVTANIATPVVVSGLPAVSLSNSANAIGSVVVTSLPAGSNTVTVSNFPTNQVVSNAANFEVFVQNFPAASNVSVTNFPSSSNVTLTSNSVSVSSLPNVTVTGLKFDSNGDLLVNAGVISGGGGNPAAGAIGSNVPSDGDYIAYANSTGQLIGVSTSNPLPVTGTFSANVSIAEVTLGPGSNTIGNVGIIGTANVSVSNFPAQSNVSVIGTVPVSNAANFEVFVQNFPATSGNVGIIGQVTVANAPNFEVYVENFPSTSNVTLTSNSVSVSSLPPDLSQAGIGGVHPQPANAVQLGVLNTGGGYYDAVSTNNPLPVSNLNSPSVVYNGNAYGAQSGLLGYAVASEPPPPGLVSSGQITPLIADTNGVLYANVTTIPSVTQNNASLLHATVANAANFQVYVENFPSTSNVSIVGNTTVQGSVSILGNTNVDVINNVTVSGLKFDSNSDLIVNASVTGQVTVANAANFQVSVTNFPATSNVTLTSNSVSVSSLPPVSITGTVPVSNAANFQVFVQNFPATSNVSIVGNTTVNGLKFDSNGELLVNAGVISGGGGNPAAGATGSAVPADASYTGYADGSGHLVGVSATAPFPTQDVNTQAPNNSGSAPPNASQIGWYNGDNFIPVGPYTAGLPVQNLDLSQAGTGVTYGQPTNAVQLGVVSGSVWDAVAPGNPLPVTDALLDGCIVDTGIETTGFPAQAQPPFNAVQIGINYNEGYDGQYFTPICGGGTESYNDTAPSAMPVGLYFDGCINATPVNANNPLPVYLAAGSGIQTYIIGGSTNPNTSGSAYPQGACVGGLMVFTNIIAGVSATITSAILYTTTPQTSGFKFAIMYAEPSNTYTDFEVPTFSADSGLVIATIDFDAGTTIGGTTFYTVGNIDVAFNTTGAPVFPAPPTPTTLYGVLICEGNPIFSNTSDYAITITVTA
jgi:hypothetical protein